MSIDPSSIPSFGVPQQPVPAAPPIVRPDPALLTQLLDQMQIKHGVDGEGDIYAGWEGFRVFYMVRGEAPNDIFAVRAFYDRGYPLERKAEILEVIDEWNRDTLWPKVYTHTHEDGTVRLIGEVQMVIGNGVNIDFFATQTVNCTQACVGFNGWITEKLGAEEGAAEVEDAAEGEDADSAESADRVERAGGAENAENAEDVKDEKPEASADEA